MFKLLLFLLVSLSFVSCTNKNNAFKYFEKANIQSQTIQNTKKTDILLKGEPKVLFWATYLNNIEKFENLKKETFIVTVYFTDASSQDIVENNYKVMLNGKDTLTSIKIDKDNLEYKEMLVSNSWANHYLVEFDEIKDVYNLNLKLTNGSSQAQLKFEK